MDNSTNPSGILDTNPLDSIPKPEIHRDGGYLTTEEYNENLRKAQLLEYLGISIDVFDGKEDNREVTEEEATAIMLVLQNKPIPPELEKKLIEKKEKKNSK